MQYENDNKEKTRGGIEGRRSCCDEDGDVRVLRVSHHHRNLKHGVRIVKGAFSDDSDVNGDSLSEGSVVPLVMIMVVVIGSECGGDDDVNDNVESKFGDDVNGDNVGCKCDDDDNVNGDRKQV